MLGVAGFGLLAGAVEGLPMAAGEGPVAAIVAGSAGGALGPPGVGQPGSGGLVRPLAPGSGGGNAGEPGRPAAWDGAVWDEAGGSAEPADCSTKGGVAAASELAGAPAGSPIMGLTWSCGGLTWS